MKTRNRWAPMLLLAAWAFPAHGQTAYTLEQLTDLALHNNQGVRSSRLDVEAASLQRKEAFTKYFPQVQATGAWFNANQGLVKAEADPSSLVPASLAPALAQQLPAELLAALSQPVTLSLLKNGVLGGVTAMQPVFAGGRIVNGNKLARVGEEASLLRSRLSEEEVRLTTGQYFWQLATLQEKLSTVRAAEVLLDSLGKDVSMAVKAGVTLHNDLLQVRLRQNETESQRLSLLNGLSVVRLMLAQYCGLRDTAFALMPATEPSPLPLRADQGQALPRTAEYQLLEKNVEATALQHKMAVGQQLPSVGVGVGYSYNNLMDRDQFRAMVFATVSVPLSDWWGGSYAARRKKVEWRKAQEQLADQSQLLTIRMQKTWNDVEEARLQWELAGRSVEQARENLRLSRNRYRAGVATMSDLLEAQLLHQQACDKRADALGNYQVRLLTYRQAVGSL